MPLTRRPARPVLTLVATLVAGTVLALADDTPRLDAVVVTGAPAETESFDLPYSIDSIDMRRARGRQLGVNASETLIAVPGLTIQNRNNYAQDLQISIRGFGARSAFGVRGVKLIADGIPATTPDGQGQAASFNLDTAERIEVLRGPFATIYGNHSGGVIQLFSRQGEGPPSIDGGVTAGSWGTRRYRLGAEGARGGVSYLLNASRFETDGYRRYSAAQRDQAFAHLVFEPSPDSTLRLVASALDQPETEDPQGLSWEAFRRDPRGVGHAALDFRTRKRISHQQGGMVYERRFGADTLQLRAYAGQRRVVQYLSIPKERQQIDAFPASAGGVVDFNRDFHGLGVRWEAARELAGGSLQFTTGLDYDRSVDDRQGYENFVGDRLGVRGVLRRDETNTITSLDPYVQASWERGRWQWSAGLRHSTVRIRVDDDYIRPGNPDDSGSVTYRRATPAVGVMYALSPLVNLYAGASTGFETPTLGELSYSPDDSGFNLGLRPARSRQLEAGIKAFVGENTRVNVALFDIRTRDEIVVAGSQGGRTTYANAARTERQGIELGVESELTRTLSARAALNWIDARYSRDFTAGANTIASGNRLPGIPRFTAWGELAWSPCDGLELAAEAVHRGRVEVNDANDARAAPAHTLLNLRLSADQRIGPWEFGQLLRVDNVFDSKHVSSVIVGQSQGRYYEAGLARSWYAGVSARYRF